MRTIILLTLFAFPFLVHGQSKKDAKKNKVKSATVVQINHSDEGENRFKESYIEFDKQGNTVLEIEYSKDGSIKNKTTAKYDAYENRIEETYFNSKDNAIIKRTFKYNANNDRIEETESKDDVFIKKTTFNYDVKGLKTNKKIYNKSESLKSEKKWSYEYYN
ncbi:MAG TPA: hypothetical protein DDX39_07780 [Bacteroidales bacterium]|nr:MAG: hypothetical protein A2W98_14335 [Bacteroidetes bacterium GWF2_33_38]OFY74908.1 MAG: hypothetical protein A2265_10275 [Bacteroidetes bacterium RIFOXYA12_FULL_33_9]OFY90443.1 MAG: hypothetical protein A2236_11015 [Bacteroidetes bacterium RIFOXYA2_FULL_33_7]HBF88525.1 hypothetical protein [Bacteroidales bacterium]